MRDEVETQACATHKWRDRFRKGWVERILFHRLGDHTLGGSGVPLERASKSVRSRHCEYVIGFVNDAFEVGLGYPDHWKFLCPRGVFLRFVLWYLWKWAWSDWFGLRRRLWYWLLSRRVKRYVFRGEGNPRLETTVFGPRRR